MEISPDPYEQKLYHMFKSHDTDSVGTLDQTALLKLCKSLELNDQGNVLIHSLLAENTSRVSFKAFKEALLNFLGTEMEESRREKTLVFHEDEYLHGAPDSPGREVSPKLVMGTKKYGRRSRPQSLVSDTSPSDSDNEMIAVVPNINNKVQRSSSQSEMHGTRRRRPTSGSKLKRCASLPAQKNPKARDQINKQQATIAQNQLASSVESLGNLDFENLSHTLYDIWTKYCNELGTNYLNRNELIIVCERVGLNKVAEKVAEEVFEKLNLSPNEKINFDEFIGLIQNDANDSSGGVIGGVGIGGGCGNDDTLTSTIDRNFCISDDTPTSIIIRNDLCNRKDTTSTTTADKELLHANKEMPRQMVPACDIIEMWEAAGVIHAKKLMTSLGFDEDLVPVSVLANALEEELRNSPNESELLLKASLVLHKTEVIALKQAFRQLVEENKKLHTDNRDVNKRAAILAQEIDERHAALETTTKSEIRMLEQRHAEVIRDLTAQLANDRENWSNLNARLEARIKTFEVDELKYKLEIQTIQDENSALETEQISLHKHVTELLETNIKLNNEIGDLVERQRNDDGNKGEKETEEVLELIDKVTTLQIENANLRDKNDELVSEIEGLNFEVSRNKNKKSSSRTNLETVGDNLSDDPEHSSLGVKRRGDSPSKARITEESPRLGKLRKCSNENSESETSGDWVALNSELGNTLNSSATNGATTSGFSDICDTKEDEIRGLKEKYAKVADELKNLKNSKSLSNENEPSTSMQNDSSDKYQARCQELENSLEQMRKAYEDCEDYWQSKLTEERQLFDKERQIYEDEQHESDKKFAELMEKVREYEEQFSKDGRLSPIDERDNLEQQYADLEEEAEEIRSNAKKMFEEKTKEIIKLQDQIQEMQTRLGDKVEISGANLHSVPEPSELGSPASSPICYLWNQSTIQAPARDYQNPNWDNRPKKETSLNSLSTSETAIFSTTAHVSNETDEQFIPHVSPIQKPNTPNKLQRDSDETGSNASAKSFETRSVASTHSIHKTSIGDLSNCPSPNGVKEELKRLKYFELQLKEQIRDLSQKRDGLIMELQQLQEAKPVLEKAYARAAHPSLLQRVNHLEQKNRHLQTVLRQQQQYTESIMHQTWQQQRAEISELRNRLETQSMIMAEQVQRLANADLLVKDLYVENSHLAANIQRLEQQRSRANILHQHHGLSGVPGMP